MGAACCKSRRATSPGPLETVQTVNVAPRAAPPGAPAKLDEAVQSGAAAILEYSASGLLQLDRWDVQHETQ